MKLCIVGYPLGHSLSPAFYNRYFQLLGIRASYGVEEISPEDFDRTIGRVIERYDGFNVTIPFKERILDYVEVDEEARMIHAVNCVFNGRGYNTDWLGFVRSVEGIEIAEPVLVLGAGGAARAVLYGLLKLEVERVLLVNRTYERAERLATSFEELGLTLEVYDLSELKKIVPLARSLINATSVGLKGDTFPIKPQDLARLELVYDVVYGTTLLQKMANEAGVRHVIGGEKMLYFQALKNLEIWGLLKNEEVFEKVFEEVTR